MLKFKENVVSSEVIWEPSSKGFTRISRRHKDRDILPKRFGYRPTLFYFSKHIKTLNTHVEPQHLGVCLLLSQVIFTMSRTNMETSQELLNIFRNSGVLQPAGSWMLNISSQVDHVLQPDSCSSAR